jgi:hypothetical protein
MLNWYTKAFFGISVLIALAMSWYSMTDLATTYYQVPLWLAVMISLAFDVGALFLGLVSVEYAKTNDSGILAEVGAFLFIVASIYINVSHALAASYGLPGMVMFGSAPVIAGIALKVYLNFINRQAKREAGRLVERLPVSGKLTWMIYPKQSFGLLKVAMRHRLIQAAGKMILEEDTHSLFANKAGIQQADQAPLKASATIEDMPDKAPQASGKGNKAVSSGTRKASGRQAKALPARNQADIDEIVYAEGIVNLPAWLPDEPTMSISKIVDKCVENNETDIGTVINYASRIKRTPVNYSTVQKAMFRSRSKAEGLM